MVDIVDTATRSRMMAGIRGRDTKPEKVVRSMLHRQGFRFRLNRRELPGKPDLVFPGLRAVVFVHGCFWHGHDCPLFKLPGTRTEFWAAKIARNHANDVKVKQALLDTGWRVGTVWECALRGRQRDIPKTVNMLASWLRSDGPTIELRGFECWDTSDGRLKLGRTAGDSHNSDVSAHTSLLPAVHQAE